MTAPPLTETDRQRALDAYRVLDTLPELAFDDLVRVAAVVCDVPRAALTLIDRDRQWFKAGHGVDLVETPREYAFCDHAIRTPGAVLEIPDAHADVRVRDNPYVTGASDTIRFYAGAPLVTPSGAAIGALCVLDGAPRQLDARQRDALSSLARIAMHVLEARHRVRELTRDQALATATGPATALAQPYALAVIEVQGHAALVRRLGDAAAEALLAQLQAALSALVSRERGDSVSRAAFSPELIVVAHGTQAQATLDTACNAARRLAALEGVPLCVGIAHAETPQEPPSAVFLRADIALSADKDRPLDPTRSAA